MTDGHSGWTGEDLRRSLRHGNLRGEDRRLHLVGPRRRPVEHRPIDQCGHRRIGYFPGNRSLDSKSGCLGTEGRNVVYLINADTGQLIGNASGGVQRNGLYQRGRRDQSNGNRKNALQADPTAAGDNGSFTVNKAYLGDIDGKYWRFSFGSTGAIDEDPDDRHVTADLQLVGAALRRQHRGLHVLSTGSDLLPSTHWAARIRSCYGLKNGGRVRPSSFSQPD